MDYTGGVIKGRPPRLAEIFQRYDAPVFFVTICAMHRRKFPALDKVESAFRRYADRTMDFNVAVGRYVIMPDHMHFFVCGDESFKLAEWVKSLKRAISSVFPKKVESIWQPGFFDHLLRNDESYSHKWRYVCENPVRAGLVSKIEDWPFQGEVCCIDRA
jgi:putative transposase